jgi:hypothetical protein
VGAVKLQEQEFFATREPSIANAQNAAARKRLIAALPTTNPDLWREWTEATRVAQGQSHFVREVRALSAVRQGRREHVRALCRAQPANSRPHGRAGFIVPTGIATDDTTKEYFQALVRSKRPRKRLYDFRERGSLLQRHPPRVSVRAHDNWQARQADLVFLPDACGRRSGRLGAHFSLAPCRLRDAQPEHAHLPHVPLTP